MRRQLSAVVFLLGLALAWKKYRWVGLAPLFMDVGFTANLALARVSGWRYNLPIDWVVMLYFAMGLAQMLIWARIDRVGVGLYSPHSS